MFTYAKTATVSTKEIMCVVLQDTVKKNRRRVYWPLMNTSLLYFPNIRSCLPRGPATAGIRTRFQQMKPKEFKTLMLIYFCSVLSKSIWTGIPPLPSFQPYGIQGKISKKYFQFSFLSFISHHEKPYFAGGRGGVVMPGCATVIIPHNWDHMGRGSVYLTFFLDGTRHQHLLTGWMGN